MTTMCPGCRTHINETSAVMLQGGLVYHQRCAPAGRRPAVAPRTVWQSLLTVLGLLR